MIRYFSNNMTSIVFHRFSNGFQGKQDVALIYVYESKAKLIFQNNKMKPLEDLNPWAPTLKYGASLGAGQGMHS